MRKNLLFITLVFLISCKSNIMHLADIDTRDYDIDYTIEEDKEIVDFIAPYKEVLDEKMNVVVAYTPEELTKDRPNSTLGSWFANLLMDIGRDKWESPDFAFQNYGGLRLNGIGKGDVTVGTIYELMPFDNTLMLVEADSSHIQMMMDGVAQYGGAPLSKEVTFLKQGDFAKNIMINNMPLKGGKSYQLVLPDYVANGGDGFDFLKELPRTDTNIYIRDLIISHFDKTEGIDTIVVDHLPKVLLPR
jgi:2',3'-cyclic-nucleotide 2'-phosphodiesterase (5'-nucleotidase family)